MRLGGILSLLVLAIIGSAYWMIDRSRSEASARAWESAAVPVPTPAPKPAPRPTGAPAKHLAKQTLAKAVAVPEAPIAPTIEPVVAPTPKPFPGAADIAVGVHRSVLAEYHDPTVRTLSLERGQLKETYVYCPGGRTDTWVKLSNGSVVARFDVDHIPTRANPEQRPY